MLTTLTLDDVLAEALSDLARRGIQSAPPVQEVNGLAVCTPPKGSAKITAEKVKDILSDFP